MRRLVLLFLLAGLALHVFAEKDAAAAKVT